MKQPIPLPDSATLAAFAGAGNASQSADYQVEVITPVMGGGVYAGVPDESMPFRAKAIRGHLRWWWRLLARSGDLDAAGFVRLGKKPSEWTAAERQSCEAEIFGSAGTGTPRKAKVMVEVFDAVARGPIPYETQNDKTWVPFGDFNELGYAMFPAQHQSPRGGKRFACCPRARRSACASLPAPRSRP